MIGKWAFARAGIIASAGLLVSACVVVEPGPGPLPPRPGPDRPQACTMEYAPVCARRGGDERTFPNACHARVDGYRVVSQGECRRAGPPPRPGGPGVCTREYRPVCATQGRRIQTFGNACEARSAGYRIVAQGECRMNGRPRG